MVRIAGEVLGGGFVGSSFWFCGLLFAALRLGRLCWLVWFRFCFCGVDLLARNLRLPGYFDLWWGWYNIVFC